jgi:hypothetical protein
MANKLLTLAGLKAAVAKTDSSDLVDGPLGKALKLYEFFGEDRMNERRDAIDDVIEAVPAAKKKAASYDRAVLKYLDDVLKAATTERKKIDTDLEKFGMKQINVQVLMTDWKGEPMHNRQVFVVFKSPGNPEITLKQEVKGGIMDFKNVELAPSGSIFVNAFPSHGASDQGRGTETYDLPKKPLVRFRAKQKSREIKKKEKSGLEAVNKAGLKGTAGVDWIVKVGGEVTSEKEMKNSYEQEVEFTIVIPEGHLDIELVK